MAGFAIAQRPEPSSRAAFCRHAQLFLPLAQRSSRRDSDEGQRGDGHQHLVSPSPQLNVGPGTPIHAVIDAVNWLDQPNEPIEVSGELWRFPAEIPELFAEMLQNWDGKTPLIQEVARDDINHITMTGNYMKNTDTSKYRLRSAVPLNMEFHTNMASTRKNPSPPQDHVRITVARFLREGGRGMEAESKLSAYIDNPGDFFDPITVPE